MKFSVLEQIVSWLIASMLALGAWLLMTSFASAAQFRSSVSSVAFLTPTSLATAPRLASSERVPAGLIYEKLNHASRVTESMHKVEKPCSGPYEATDKREKSLFLDAIERIESNGNARAIGSSASTSSTSAPPTSSAPSRRWKNCWAPCCSSVTGAVWRSRRPARRPDPPFQLLSAPRVSRISSTIRHIKFGLIEILTRRALRATNSSDTNTIG